MKIIMFNMLSVSLVSRSLADWEYINGIIIIDISRIE